MDQTDRLGETIERRQGFQTLQAAANLALLALWLWFYRPVFAYFAVIFTRVEFRTNQIVLAAVAGLLMQRLLREFRRTRALPRLDAPPRLYLPGLALALGGSLGYLLVERFLDINTLSALLFALASYGLIGLWMPPERWGRGFPAALLVIGVLPFGAHLETFAGYPLRVLSARAAGDLLAGLGFTSVGMDTILVFESGVSQVDIPCSGIKSLWTGALFLLAATWIEERPLGLRWLLIAALTGLLLAASNLLRVTLLALFGPALGYPYAAEILHLPLGVLGFSAACAAGLYLLRRLPMIADRPIRAAPSRLARTWANLSRRGKFALAAGYRSNRLSLLLLALLGIFIFAYAPRPVQSASSGAGNTPAWIFPAGMTAAPAPLNAQELAWIREGGAENADRYTFRWQGGGETLSGTVMLLTSQTWRGQHQPERCFQVFGFTVRESYTSLAAADFPLRYLSLSHPGVTGRRFAAYWLQSSSQTTDDYAKRIWADLSPARERWVLVTILFDQPMDGQSPELAPFFQALRASVARSLAEGGMP